MQAQKLLYYDMPKGGHAVEGLEETLKTSFQGRTIDKTLKLLDESFKNTSLREVLLSDAAGAVAKVLSTVWNAALPNMIGRQCAQVMTGTTPSIKVPKAAKCKAFQMGEQGSTLWSPEKTDFATIEARLWGAAPILTRSMVEDAAWDVIQRQFAAAGMALAEAETEEVVLAMLADAGSTQAVITPDTLKAADFADVIGDMEGADVKPDTIIIHPENMNSLFADATLSAGYSYGSPVIRTGVLPEIYGCKVFKTSKLTKTNALVIDSTRAGVLYVRRDITIENYSDPLQDLVGAVATERFRYGTVDANAIKSITDTHA
jgi:hypothetical protein